MIIRVVAVFEVVSQDGQIEIITHAGVNEKYPARRFAVAHMDIVRQQHPEAAGVHLVGCMERAPGGGWQPVVCADNMD